MPAQPAAEPAAQPAEQPAEQPAAQVLPPLGVYDPLGLIETRDMRRYEIMAKT